MNKSIAQRHLIQNWNAIAEKVNRKDDLANLPILDPEGTCNGLSYTFIFYHQRGMGEQFFQLLGKLTNPSNIDNIAKNIEKNEENSKEIINFIYNVYYLQKNQRKDRDSEEMTNLANNIGGEKAARRIVSFSTADDIKEPLDSLQPNDGMEIGTPEHSMAIYKTSHNTWIVYDSNNSKKHECRSLDEASDIIFDTVEKLQFRGKSLFSMDVLKQLAKRPLSPLLTKTLASLHILKIDIIEKQSSKSSKKTRPELSTTTKIVNHLNSLDEHYRKFAKASILFDLIECNELKEIEKFLTESKLDLSRPEVDKLPHLVYSNKDPKIIDLLIKHGATLNPSLAKMSILSWMIGRNDVKEIEKFLTESKLDLSRPEVDSKLPHLVRWHGFKDPRIIDLLIKHGATLNPTSSDRTSFLHAAAGSGKIEITERLLLHYRANPNLRLRDDSENYQNTPLHRAILNNDLNTVKLLLKNGADPNISMLWKYADPNILPMGTTPLQLAFEHKQDEIAKELLTWPKVNDFQQSELKIDQSEENESSLSEHSSITFSM